ncbi:ANTAR domain-containing response regulator [Candidatus Desulforudis audaxviator]|uniref:Stage 0 sporulation protein A homolog n=1 Tax=Desulforudis audaxviator (strain MP104C) TaxID=477974 RepID=B1I6A7_DESAP|nr:ANTAR domain-containing protein [Candidatus Desulforudis audaxviator]ACA60518.1 response regulator receiver and ANTAR domain protein [Candidatus Desulforudis audaxviator MP104C]AZK60589.1 putative two-component system response regulator [Candidatus Desulforudis audaxviator]
MALQERVILVDPDARGRTNIKGMLSQAEYLVIGEAEDGITALKMIRDRQPDLVLAEASLPGVNGLDLARIVHDDRLAPVILMSGVFGREMMARVREVRAAGFLPKPVDEVSLLTVVEVALAHYAEVMDLERKVMKLKEELDTRKVVERAKGILMSQLGLTEAEAFRRIQKQSMNRRLSMRAVAEAIILAHNV